MKCCYFYPKVWRAGILKFFISFAIFFLFASPAVASNVSKEYTLEELYKIALENSEKIRFSEEELYISEQSRDKATSVLMPRLSAFGGYAKYSEEKFSAGGQVIQPQQASSWGLRLDQSLSLSGREITALHISLKGVEKSRFDLFATRESYIMNVTSAYYDVLKAKKFLDIAKANVQRLTKHRDAALVRLKVGEVTKTALLRAEAELSGAKSELVKAENNLKLLRAVLSRVVGIYSEFDIKESLISQDLELKEDYLLPQPCSLPPLECYKQKAFEERADLKSLEIQKRIAEKQVSYAIGSFFPNISIEGVWLRQEQKPLSPLFNKESIYGAVKINFPFFEGGLRKAEVREAEARKRQADLLYDDLKKTIGVEVENAYLDFITLKGILKSLEDQLVFARDNFNSVTRQFEFGLANSIDVMDANTLFITAERQYSEARYNFLASQVRLKKAMGILLKTMDREN
jgi:outer membrane protein